MLAVPKQYPSSEVHQASNCEQERYNAGKVAKETEELVGKSSQYLEWAELIVWLIAA
jgi:hypothetical protein